MDHFQIESTVNGMLTNKVFLHPGPNNSSHSDLYMKFGVIFCNIFERSLMHSKATFI